MSGRSVPAPHPARSNTPAPPKPSPAAPPRIAVSTPSHVARERQQQWQQHYPVPSHSLAANSPHSRSAATPPSPLPSPSLNVAPALPHRPDQTGHHQDCQYYVFHDYLSPLESLMRESPYVSVSDGVEDCDGQSERDAYDHDGGAVLRRRAKIGSESNKRNRNNQMTRRGIVMGERKGVNVPTGIDAWTDEDSTNRHENENENENEPSNESADEEGDGYPPHMAESQYLPPSGPASSSQSHSAAKGKAKAAAGGDATHNSDSDSESSWETITTPDTNAPGHSATLTASSSSALPRAGCNTTASQHAQRSSTPTPGAAAHEASIQASLRKMMLGSGDNAGSAVACTSEDDEDERLREDPVVVDPRTVPAAGYGGWPAEQGGRAGGTGVRGMVKRAKRKGQHLLDRVNNL